MDQGRSGARPHWAGALLLFTALAAPLPVMAQTPTAGEAPQLSDEEVRAKLAAQKKRLEELEALVRAAQAGPAAPVGDPQPLGEAEVKKIVGDYLKENPGANLNNGVQTGYESGSKGGFVIRSAPDPKWTNWDDQSQIPFELRIRGYIQADYYYYKVNDRTNHLTGAPGNGGANESPDFSQLEIKRGRLIFAGAAFDPNLRYRIDIEADTRGLPGTAGGAIPGTNGVTSVGGVPGGNVNATVDHAARLNGAFVAYDFHPCWSEKGCDPDCPDGTYRYTPTVTAFAGKWKPFMGLEETLLPFHCQFVEFSMASWFFDADDDGWLMMAGTEVHARDDRLYVRAMLTNGNEGAVDAAVQNDDYPGFNGGFWYDFGGSWNEAQKRWDLFGDCISDIDYSCNPVVRVGGAVNLVPMDRRSEYADDELNRVRIVPGAPGGTTLLGLLNGGGIANNAAGVGQFALDAADEYTFNAFIAGKWHGFSLYNDWWFRDVDNFRGRRAPSGTYPGNGVNQPILYSTTLPGGAATATLFTAGGFFDYGTSLQGGYFVVPKKLELVARWSAMSGDSGNIYGNGASSLLTTAQKTALGIPSPATTPVRVFSDAFKNNQTVNEYAAGVNYFFYRELVKWQTDLSYYQGGNPASGGQSAAGFIPGVDGWMLRTQLQFGW